jgi:hypothetical protein
VWSARRLYSYNEFQMKPVRVQFELSTSQYEDISVRSSRREVNAVTVNNSHGRSTQTRQRIGTRSTEENKRSTCEELAQCAYNKIESVIINCKSACRFIQ